MGWTLGLPPVVVLLYLLSAPAVLFFSISGWGTGKLAMPPKWVIAYVMPYDKLSSAS